jgi:hypothetical protein
MNKSNKLALASSIICFSGINHAATAVSDTFDTDIGSWIRNTTQTNNSFSATGGNPDGYLLTNNFGGAQSFHAVGAQNRTPDYSGVFAPGLWTISVDLNFLRGDFTNAWLRFRYQDSSNNGWHYSLEDTTFNNSWSTYTVSFDTTWDDATAMANGWVMEPGANSSFSQLWTDTWTSEVRILGTNNSTNLLAGIDNYIVRTSAVPLPSAVWLFGSGLLGLVGIARRKS